MCTTTDGEQNKYGLVEPLWSIHRTCQLINDDGRKDAHIANTGMRLY